MKNFFKILFIASSLLMLGLASANAKINCNPIYEKCDPFDGDNGEAKADDVTEEVLSEDEANDTKDIAVGEEQVEDASEE